jgi:hypothetical protein
MFLYKKPGFKNFSAILLLFVFALGITPKKTLHDWFAKHKDTTSLVSNSSSTQITKAGFNCNCEDLVAESNFITSGSFIVINIPPVNSFISFYTPSFVSRSLFQNNLRGPPLKF